MGANQGSGKSSNSWSFNFRFIYKHARLAAFALMAAILLSPGQSKATGPEWVPCLAGKCVVCPATCLSAGASCASIAYFYSSPYGFLTPHTPNTLLCYSNYLHSQYSYLVNPLCPPGLVPDINTSIGCSPANGVMPNKNIGGGQLHLRRS
jgi:hypothetical protein